MDPITPILQSSPYALVLYLLGRLIIQVLADYIAMQANRDDFLARLRAVEVKLDLQNRDPLY